MTIRTVSLQEVSKHDNAKDCWCIIHGKVYDLTKFLSEHPGGSKVILKYAGKDATSEYDLIHPRVKKILPAEKFVGDAEVDPDAVEEDFDASHHYNVVVKKKVPSINNILSTDDFESLARQLMSPEAWYYYSSGADEEITLRENRSVYQRVYLIPRVLIDVEKVDLSVNILNQKSELPFYITATALGKLGHPQGELNLTRAAANKGIIQMVPTLSSYSLEEILEVALDKQTLFLQLYVNPDRELTREIVQAAELKGCKGLFITVDAPQLGSREKDVRNKFSAKANVQTDISTERSRGVARSISTFIDSKLNWKDLDWFKSITKMPIVLKGIQCKEDALIAAKFKCQGIVLSNHGGRQIDTCRSALEILPEVVDELNKFYQANKEYKERMEIYMDGGIRRGSDIFKALALGAKAVGIGRPFLYSMSTYGQEGIELCIDILKEELEMVMRLMGTQNISQINSSYLDTSNIRNRNLALDRWGKDIYEHLPTPKL